MNSERIAAVTILYNPSPEVIDNINSYLESFDALYLIDNSPEETRFVKSLISEKTKYYHDGENYGIAKRLNQAAEIAKSEGFNFLLTMDQDSSFDKTMLSDYLSCFHKAETKNLTAIYGIENEKRLFLNGTCREDSNQLLITSGSIVNLEIHHRVNGFDENLFIDFVDIEYCLRSMQNGFESKKFRNILLDHKIGIHGSHYSLKTFRKSNRSLHSPLRLYYMMRNYLYISRKYRMLFKKDFKQIKKNLLVSIKNNLLYNNERKAVALYLFNAIYDFRKDKMGRRKIG
jgi:rhamnosyltransferase